MATFDESQVTSLAEIFGTSSDVMSFFLDLRAAIITDADKTAILADITSYQAIEDDNVHIEAKDRNFGARIDPTAKRGTIKRRIGGLLGWETHSSGAGLVRG